MKFSNLKILAATCLSLCTSQIAQAQTTPINHTIDDVRYGHWATYHHTTPDGLNIDSCMTMFEGPNGTFLFFHSDKKERFDFRMGNFHWTLPPSTQGNLQITIGEKTLTLPMKQLDSQALISELSPQNATSLLDHIESGKTATLQFGSGTKYTLPIQRSKRALNALRTCTAKAKLVDLSETNHLNHLF